MLVSRKVTLLGGSLVWKVLSCRSDYRIAARKWHGQQQLGYYNYCAIIPSLNCNITKLFRIATVFTFKKWRSHKYGLDEKKNRLIQQFFRVINCHQIEIIFFKERRKSHFRLIRTLCCVLRKLYVDQFFFFFYNISLYAFKLIQYSTFKL